MKSKAIFLALLAFVFGAQARPVVESEAIWAANAWAKAGLVSDGQANASAERVTARKTAQGTGFFAVRLSGGSTLFLSGDTTRRPVIALVPTDAETIDPASPLWALLSCDQDAQAMVVAAQSAGGAGSSASVDASTAEREWSELLAGNDGKGAIQSAKAVTAATTHVTTLSDVRAGPLVKSQWDQSTAAGNRCYNYSTPKLSDDTYAVCGCVATAMSQLMRYHRHPTASVTPVTRTCYVEPSTKGKSATKNLTTQGGVYDWSKMPLKPANGVTDEQCRAIGKLTSDAGISVCMNYDTLKAGGSGAFMFNVVRALKEVFGYASACYYRAESDVTKASGVVRNAMLSNFDAGYPVLMGISGAGGHAIVGDGYGYKGDTLYVHLNMGWSGQDDVWYNLPDIDCATGYHFKTFEDVVFNVFPKAGGTATLSGRVVDDEGTGIDGSLVQICRSGETDPVAVDLTTNGVYGARLAPGTYDVTAFTSDGRMSESQKGILLKAPTVTTTSYTGIIYGSWTETYKNVPKATAVGNSQSGTAIVLYQPTVRVGEKNYANLDKALAAAALIYAADPEKNPVTVEVIDTTLLEKPFTIDFPCVLTSTDPQLMEVVRADGAVLTVATDGQVVVSDLTVSGAASEKVFDVQKGGSVTVAAGVKFGVSEMTPAIVTAQSDGFVLAAELSTPFAVDCTSARGLDGVFGYATCDFETARKQAPRFVNLSDKNGEIAGEAVDGGSAPYALKWSIVEVPLEEAAAYYVLDGTVKTNCFRRLDRLFELYAKADAPGVVTVLADGQLSSRVKVMYDMTISSPVGATLTAAAGGEMGFDISADAKVCVRNLTFDGMTGDSLFVVSGKGSRLAIEPQTVISNFIGNANAKSAAVRVTDGAELVVGGEEGYVLFGGCANDYSQSSAGGAIHVSGAESKVVLQGHVAIDGCRSRGTGGGVYVGDKSKILLSGDLTICDNVSGSQSLASDVYCIPSDGLELAGLLKEGSQVGVRRRESGWQNPGFGFAVVSSDVSASDAYDSAAAFFCDGTADVKAVLGEDFSRFCWADAGSGITPVPEELAVARVVFADGLVKDYGSIEDAFAVLEGRGKIEIRRSTSVSDALVVSGEVTLTGIDDEVRLGFQKGGSFQIGAGCGLTVAGLVVDGGDAETSLFVVEGGELTLDAGAVIGPFEGTPEHSESAVSVREGGRFVMKDGSRMEKCVNVYQTDYSGNGRGGAVNAGGSTVRIEGGTISDCYANLGGGVCIGNLSVIEIGGSAQIDNNGRNNVYVPDYSHLVLISPLVGSVGVLPGPTADQVVFGRLADEFVGTDGQLADSAHNFKNDKTGDIGVAVRNDKETLLVWSDGLDANGNYTDADGKVYAPVSGGSDVRTPVPTPREGLVYTGSEQQGFEAGHGYTVGGVSAATDAGDYEAVLTLKPGFVWDDGTKVQKTVKWTIAKATYDMSGVTFEDMTAVYDGQPKTNAISGKLPEGVSVAYYDQDGKLGGNVQIGVGIYEITARFTGDADNYEPIDDMTATLTITDSPVPPPPPPPPVATNYPTPIAFQSIENLGDGQWRLVVTNGVKDCWYSLFGGTALDESTFTQKAKFQLDADGDVIFTVDTGTDAQWFWRAKAEPGEVREN